MYKRKKMTQLIPFEDGEYLVEQAFLLSAGDKAVALENAVIKVSRDGRGNRYVDGYALVCNVLMVKLLDDTETIDMILDLGGEFKYFLADPEIKSGKIFSPDVKSTLQFYLTTPWRQVPVAEFDALVSKLTCLSD